MYAGAGGDGISGLYPCSSQLYTCSTVAQADGSIQYCLLVSLSDCLSVTLFELYSQNGLSYFDQTW